MNRLLSNPIFTVVVASVLLTILALATEALNIDHPKYNHYSSSNIVAGSYIVTFSRKQLNSADFFATDFQKQFKNANLKMKQDLTHEFFNGISFSIDHPDENIHQATVMAILERDDVTSVSPIRLYSSPTSKVATNSDSDFSPSILPHAMTQVDLVHNVLKNKGKGVLVGVIDSGVDYLLPALGGGFGKGFKVSKGYDLVGDKYNGHNTPMPDNDPLDACGANSGSKGHGTHVSGIIAGYDAKKNFTGVAPEANLGMWRVFGCSGKTGNDIIIKALLMAYDAGCDVINLSLGTADVWSRTEDSEANVVNKIASKGVNVIISDGNSGTRGIFTLDQPSTATGAFSVSSVENDYYISSYFTATGVNHTIDYTPNSGANVIKNGVVVIADKNPGGPSDSCTAAQISSDIKGKIALISRGTCDFSTKVNLAAAAGATGAIIYDNVAGDFTEITVPKVTIPVVTITQIDGQTLITAIKKGTVSLTFKNFGPIKRYPDAGTVSSFSSLGSSAELDLKPDIAGVGGHVYSTLPRYLGSWGMKSGTSMATPYISGSIALYKSYNGRKETASYINEQFQNYAKPAFVYKNSSTIDTPIRQGAGLVQVYDALTQKVHVTPAKISFNDTATTKYRTHTFIVANKGFKTVSYELLNNVTIAISPYNVKNTTYTPLEPAGNVIANADLVFSTNAFILAPGSSREIKVTVTPPDTNIMDHIFYGGFIQIKSKTPESGKSLKIPYFGVKGIQKTLPIFDTASGFPCIVDASKKLQSAKKTYIFDRSKNATTPHVVIRLLTPTARINADLINASSQKNLGKFLTGLDYLERHFTDPGAQNSTYIWNGTYIPASIPNAMLPIPAPDGTYTLRLSALKLLGNPSDKNDWEIWTSGLITLKN